MIQNSPPNGTSTIDQIPQKTSFWDRSKRRAYEIARETAVKIIDDPNVVKSARLFIIRNWYNDPSKAKIFPIWAKLLRLEPPQIARQLLADTDFGEYLRDTMPSFGGLPPNSRTAAINRAHKNDAIIRSENNSQ